MDYLIDVTAGRVRIRGSGRLTDEEMIDCVRALRADPSLRPGMHTLSDMRGIDVAFTPTGIAQMIEAMKASDEHRGAARAAIVVDSSTAFGMGRMFELRSEGATQPALRVFEDIDAAEAWLDETDPA